MYGFCLAITQSEYPGSLVTSMRPAQKFVYIFVKQVACKKKNGLKNNTKASSIDPT